MRDDNSKYQTLNGFLRSPFGKTENMSLLVDYENKFLAFDKAHKIKVEGVLELDGVYFIHLRIPSESNAGSLYDVVIEFFAYDDTIKKGLTIENYYVKFFSNSPSFVYKYSALYKLNGYLIESLYEKYDSGMLDVLPERTNSNLVLSFDKSLYFACRHIQLNKPFLMSKMPLKFHLKNKNANKFFNDIQDTDAIKITNNIASLEKSIKKDLVMNDKKSKSLTSHVKRNTSIISNSRDKITPNSKIHSKKSTIKKAGIAKKSAKSSTTGSK